MLRPAFLGLVLALGSCASPGRAVTVYGGRYTDNSLPEEILLLQPVEFEDSELVAVALSEPVHRPSDARQWELEGQVAKHFGDQDHWELNALSAHRWLWFPWNDVLKTTLALGGGASYATEVPELEERFHGDTGSANTLFYLLIEATFAPPSAEHWSVVLRVHHRSGIFGLIDGVDGGSNVIALGLKFTY